MKRLVFVGDSAKRLREFPDKARRYAGYELDKVQNGEEPSDWKSMPSIGKGVYEIRVRDETGAFRVIYVSRLAEAIFVLHAFQKKSEATDKRDIELAKSRYNQITKG
jgi:phage-related protein